MEIAPETENELSSVTFWTMVGLHPVIFSRAKALPLKIRSCEARLQLRRTILKVAGPPCTLKVVKPMSQVTRPASNCEGPVMLRSNTPVIATSPHRERALALVPDISRLAAMTSAPSQFNSPAAMVRVPVVLRLFIRIQVPPTPLNSTPQDNESDSPISNSFPLSVDLILRVRIVI